MTHIAGHPGAWNKQSANAIERFKPDLMICGHSHILKVMRDLPRNLLHLNPGAAGHTGWNTMRTAMRFEINHHKLENLEVIELGPRGRGRKS